MFHEITRGALTLYLARAGEASSRCPINHPSSPDCLAVLHG
jgi:hypothetical protein